MEKQELNKLTDEALLVLKKELQKSKLFHALSIGFFAGILVFAVFSWSVSTKKNPGFLVPMFIPVIFIYRLLKNPNKNEALEEVLKERNLN
jgi:hypothetical protein